MRFKISSCVLGACLMAALLMAPVASAQGSKEQMHSEMLAIAQQMWALKPLLDVSPQAAAEYAALEARYRSISDAMGGDDPARAIGDSPSAALATPAGRAPRVAPGPPPGCNTALTTAMNNTPVQIPTGPAVVTSMLVVAGAGTYLFDLDLTTFITHTFASDLDITLLSPGGTIMTLTTDNGGGNDNVYNGTVWDDDADPDGQVPYTTNDGLVTDSLYANLVLESPLVPEEAMGAFIGEDPNGTWTITISDDLGGDGGFLNSWTLNITTLTGTLTTAATQATNNTPVAIPTGPAVVNSMQAVAGAGTYLCDLNLTTFITHTFASDLDITLLSPAGTIMTLTTDNGGGNDNVYNGTVWDDDADPDGQVPYTTNDGLVTDSLYANLALESPLVPEEALGAFIGEDPNGTWTITISDDLGGDGGFLNSWTLDATTCLCGAPNLIFNPDPKTVDNPGPVLSGDFLTYTITVQNIGNAAATNVVVMDPIPAMTTYVSDDCGGANVPPWTWNIGNLGAGASVTCNLTVQVDPAPLPPGQICNQGYTVDSDQTAPFTGQPQCVDLVPADLMEFETAAGDK